MSLDRLVFDYLEFLDHLHLVQTSPGDSPQLLQPGRLPSDLGADWVALPQALAVRVPRRPPHLSDPARRERPLKEGRGRGGG